MRLLLTGSRDWFDYRIVKVMLLGMMNGYETPLIIAEGCARGLDSLGERFCQEFDVENRHFPALWKDHTDGSWCQHKCRTNPSTCYGAGPRRNQLMLDEFKPQVVMGFKDNLDMKSGRGGTEDMLRRANDAEIPTFHMRHCSDVTSQRLL